MWRTPRSPRRVRRSPRATIAAAGLLSAAAVIAGLVGSTPASAATATNPVHQIVGSWLGGTPASVGYGQALTAEYKINTNDATDPYAQDQVTDVTVTLTATNGAFSSIPTMCLTTTTPPSSISTGGTTLTCDLGTITEGTATVIDAPVRATSTTGGSLSVSGTVRSDQAPTPVGPAVLPPVPTSYTHGMDLVISAPNQNYQQVLAPSRSGGNRQTVIVDYGLSLSAGSAPGPSSYSFGLAVSPTVAGQLPGLQWEGCAPVDDTAQATGIPYSDPTHPDRTNDPACSISGSGANYTVTVTGLDYSLQHVPSHDSLGNVIPSTTDFVAAGKLVFSYTTPITQSTGVDFTATPTPFTFTDGVTQPETNTTNDSSDTTLVLPGAFADQWAAIGPGVGRSAWDANYFAAPGAAQGARFPIPSAGTSTNPGTYTNSQLPALSNADSTAWSTYTGPGGADMAGECTMLSNPADFAFTQVDFFGEDGATPTNITTAHIWYRTDAINTKTETCGEPVGVAGSPWTEANLSPSCATHTTYISPVYSDDDCLVNLPPGVTAVKMTWNPAVDTQQHHTLRAWGYIPSTATVGSDSWTVGAFNASYDTSTVFGGSWPNLNNYINISENSSVYATIPGCTYAAPTCNTNGQRDAMRIQGATGVITKTTPDTTASPGVPVTYDLTAEADLSVATPPAQTFPVVDTLPAGMTYVSGSGTPAPVVTTNGSGQQVLTWTFTDVPANTAQHVTYQAETAPGSSIPPGTTLTNTAEIDVPGDNRPAIEKQASASVTVPDNGSTMLGKSAEASVLSFYGDSSAWDLTVHSLDPVGSTFTDTIDVLPSDTDGRGTDIAGTYTVTGVQAPAGSAVYYTTAPTGSLSVDPDNTSNGYAPGSVAGNTVGWSTTPVAHPTGIRIIGPALAPGAEQIDRILYTTPAPVSSCVADSAPGAAGPDNLPGQTMVNSAGSIVQHTALHMEASATVTIGNCYALSIKKYVLVPGGDPSAPVYTSGAGTASPVLNTADWSDANSLASYPTYTAGATVHYAVVATNLSAASLSGISISDPDAPSCGTGGGTTSLTAYGTAGDTRTFSCTTTAAVGTTVNTVTASATPPPSPDGTPSPPISASDPAGIVVPEPLVVAKSASPASRAPAGSTVTYSVTVSEPAGSAAAWPSPSLTDDLSDVLDDATLVPGSVSSASSAGASAPDAGSAAITGSTLSWTAPALMPGETVTVTYSVKVDAPDTGNGVLANTVVTPTGESNCSSGSTDPTCSTSNPVQSLQIVKKASEAAANPGDTVTYTVTLTNTGQYAFPASGPGAATFRDDLTGDLNDATYGNDATASAGPAPSYSAPVLSWTGPLAIDGVVTITYSVTVDSPDTGPHTLANTVTSSTPGSTCPSGSTNPACSTRTPVSGITVRKSATPTTVSTLGQTVTYTFVVTDAGQTTLSDVGVDDTSTSPAGPLASGPTCQSLASPAGTCSGPSTSLVPGQSATFTGTYEATQADLDNGTIEDSAVANGTPPGRPSIASPPSPAVVNVTPAPAVSITKTANASGGDTSALTVGETISYSYLVTNTGNVTLSRVAVDDPTLGAVTCPTPAGPGLAPGASLTCTGDAPHTVTQTDVDAGKVTDTATASGSDTHGDSSSPSSPSTVTVPAPANPAVSIAKSGTVTPSSDQAGVKVGDTIDYRYVVTNTGNVTLSRVAVSDPTLGAVTCPTPAGPGLAPGASLTCTGDAPHTVTQTDVDAGKVTDTATATGTTPGGKTSPPSPPSTVTIPAAPGAPTVSIVKKATVSPAADQGGAQLGDTIRFSYVVTNTGNVTDRSVTVTDPTGGPVTCPTPAAPGLAPGDSLTCTADSPHVVTGADVIAGQVTDTATATGTDVQGRTSPPSDPSTVTVPVTPAPTPDSSASSGTDRPLSSIIAGHGWWGPGGPTGKLLAVSGTLLIGLGGAGLAVLRRRRRSLAS